MAFLILALAPGWGWGVLACGLAGLGFYQFHNTLQTMATQMAPTARGTSLSLFAFCFFAGQAAGAGLGAWLVDHLGAPWLFAGCALVLPWAGASLARHLKDHARKASAL
jgi:predicted MFS family arabinose efflux permease